jgi:putative endonuclease
MNDTGRAGEDLAARWLEAQGMRVLCRNFRHRRNEIDLVVRDGQTVAFVEVKTRRLGPGGAPAAAVGPAKRRRIASAAAAWIVARPGEGREFRFDVIEVTNAPGRAPLVEHWPDAFRIEDVGCRE